MPLPKRWFTVQPFSPLTPEEPAFVLTAPGSITPASPAGARRLLRVLAAGSLLAVAARPYRVPLPGGLSRPLASTFTVINLSPAGPGSLRQAIVSANQHPGPDTINFQPGLTGMIPITTELSITDSVQILGPGPGALSVSGGNVTRVFYLYSSGQITATISGLTIRDGRVAADGAGLLDEGQFLVLDNVAIVSNTVTGGNGGGLELLPGTGNHAGLTLRNSVVSGNHAEHGAGIYAQNTSQPLLIQNTRIISNAATSVGGGLMLHLPHAGVTLDAVTIADNTAKYGGGVMLYQTDHAQTVISGTTISGNSAVYAGGIAFYDVTDPVRLVNSTLSGNHASSRGGGVYLNHYDQPISIHNATIVSNTAGLFGGGLSVPVGSVAISNTIVAGNLAPNGPDIFGGVQLSYDLVQVTSTAIISDAGGNLFGLDPLLGPLADNGGPTLTHLPGRSSPAIDAGDPAFAAPPSTDQRGRARQLGRLDIGAVEVAAKLFLPLVRR